MSATVDADKLSNYFNGCPTLHVPGRTFPVDVRFLEDAIEYADWSIQENSPYAINRESSSKLSLQYARLRVIHQYMINPIRTRTGLNGTKRLFTAMMMKRR